MVKEFAQSVTTNGCRGSTKVIGKVCDFGGSSATWCTERVTKECPRFKKMAKNTDSFSSKQVCQMVGFC